MGASRQVATRLTCFAIISSVETDLRQIVEELVQENSFSEVIPSDVKVKATKRAEADTTPGCGTIAGKEIDYLEYTDFADLAKILHILSGRISDPEKNTLIDVAKKIEVLAPSRNRVCHSRPLETDDFPALMDLGEYLSKCKAFQFSTVKETLRLLVENPSFALTLTIPEFWGSDAKSIQHNLPLPDFDDTGFLGRAKDRNALNKYFTSAHPVITVIGEGGIGKTALTLRCLYDLLEVEPRPFDAIIWISLKTRALSAAGIREITGAITSALGIVKEISAQIDGKLVESTYEDALKNILENMGVFKILLVIDNFETLANGNLRPLLESIPPGSKILITSRIGLGEMELRYPLAPLDEKAALTLIRKYANSLNLKAISGSEDVHLIKYCETLYFNPLLIKWFVGAVSLGADPNVLLNKKGHDFSSVIQFCFQNLYERLTLDEKRLLLMMYSARRPLTHAEIYYLTNEEHHDRVELALGTLNHSSMLKRTARTENSSINYALTDIAAEYISRSARPPSSEIAHVQELLRKLRSQAEVAVVRNTIWAYDRNVIRCSTNDEAVCAGYLRKALQTKDYGMARKEIDRAKSILPNYSENYRVAAWIESDSGDIYQADDEYRQAVSLAPKSPFLRYIYSQFLLNCMGDAPAALEQIEVGLAESHADQTLLSLKALALVRLGRYSDATPIYEGVIKNLANKPPYWRLATRDQAAECYRRWMELDTKNEDTPNFAEHLILALSVLHNAFVAGDYDVKTIESRLYKILQEAVLFAIKHNSERIGEIIIEFLNHNEVYFKIIKVPFPLYQEFTGSLKCADKLLSNIIDPNSGSLLKSDYSKEKNQYVGGVIKRIITHKNFGFITAKDGKNVFFHKGSMKDQRIWDKLTEGLAIIFVLDKDAKGWLAKDLDVP